MASGTITSCYYWDYSTSFLGLLSRSSGTTCRINSQQHQSLIKMNSFHDNKMSRFSEGSFVSSRRVILSASASTRSEMGVHNAENKEEEEEEEEEISRGDLLNTMMHWQKVQGFALAGVLAHFVLAIPLANAADALKIYGCLLKECRVELAKCVGNPSCAANIACIEMCTGRPDETECQMRCGDLFGNEVVNEFNQCALSRKKCVPKISAVGEFPAPDPSVLVKSFNISDFSGKWYITSGINPMFDTFDCQLSEFHMESNKLVGNLTWRIRTPDGSFFTRSAVQKFVQDPYQPAILYNHNNEYLNYQDDWFILSSSIENKADDYVFVYYRGRNDAWDGYGGAVVYTRSTVLPGSIIPKLERAAEGVGLDFSKFIKTDNTCGPEPPLVQRLEKTVEEGKKTVIREVEEEVTLLQRQAEGLIEAVRDADNFLRGLSKEEMGLLDDLKMEATEVEKIFGWALPIRKLR